MRVDRFKPFPTSDGALLQYFDVGKGKPLVLLAGLHTSVIAYKYVAEELQKKYRVIGLERRYEGRTIAPMTDMTMSRQGKDLDEFLSFLNLDQPILVGHSLGSSAIMSYLAQFGDSSISAAVLIDQTPKMLNDETWNLGILNLNKAFPMDLFKNSTSPLFKKSSFITGFKFFVTMRFKYKQRYSLKEKKPIFMDYLKSDWRASLTRISKPVLFIAAEHSPWWPPEHVDACVELVQNGEKKIMKNTGHGTYIVDVPQFNAVLKEWLARLD